MAKNKILVFVATYNENLNISDLFYDIIKISSEYDVLIIDDNSKDGTKGSLEKINTAHTCLTVIHRPRKMGVGSAHRAAMIYALKNKYDELVTMDADFSHTFKDLDKILEEIRNSEIIIGSRYIKNWGSTGWGYKRKLLSKYANRVAKLMLNSNINDSTSGFRSFSKFALQTIDFESTKSNGYGFQVEMVYLAEKNKLSIKEVPIVFEERRLGKSKMSIKITLEAFLLLLKIYFKKQ